MRNSFFLFTRPLRGACTSPTKKSHPSFIFPPPVTTENQRFTIQSSSKSKKNTPFRFTFATLAGNEDKHRNQAGITKLRVPRFSTALSFAVPPWLPVGIACTSTLPISNPIAAPSDREVPLLAPPLDAHRPLYISFRHSLHRSVQGYAFLRHLSALHRLPFAV